MVGCAGGKRRRWRAFSDAATQFCLRNQMSVWPAAAEGARHGSESVETGQLGLTGAELQCRLPTAEDLAGPAQRPPQHRAAAPVGGQHRHQEPERRLIASVSADGRQIDRPPPVVVVFGA